MVTSVPDQPERWTVKRARMGGLARRNATAERREQARADLADTRAELAVNDPAELDRAARIVRVALARKLLTRADLGRP